MGMLTTQNDYLIVFAPAGGQRLADESGAAREDDGFVFHYHCILYKT